jgi:hypothetical protein
VCHPHAMGSARCYSCAMLGQVGTSPSSARKVALDFSSTGTAASGGEGYFALAKE